MLVKIDETIISAYEHDKIKFKRGLNHVLNAHFNKKHFVFLSPRTAKKISELNSTSWGNYLGSDTILRIQQLGSQCSLQGGITASVGMHIEIYHNNISSPITNHDPVTENVTIWKFQITSNLEWLINPTVIYGENINDSSIFESIAKATALSKGFTVRNIKFKKEMTGGCGNIPEIVRTRSSESLDLKGACLFIADSDCKFPKKSLHKLLKDCRTDLLDYNNNAPMRLHILQSREIENLIPIELLQLSLEKKATQEETISKALQAIEQFYAQHPTHYKYIDMKEGTCTTKVCKEVACKTFFNQLLHNATSPCDEKEHVKCFQISPKLGDIILPTLKEFFISQGDFKLSKINCNRNTDEWIALADLVFSMSICNEIQPM